VSLPRRGRNCAAGNHQWDGLEDNAPGLLRPLLSTCLMHFDAAIRNLAIHHSVETIAERIGARNKEKVQRVVDGETYKRVN
jgi:hypothetical protein